MVRPPEAEPVSAERTLVATASDTSGPPSMPSTQPRTRPKAGRAATTAPKPTRLATLKAGRTAALAPAGQAPARQKQQRHDRRSQGDGHRPYPADGRERGGTPARLGQESGVHARQDDEGHQEVDGDDHGQRQGGQ